MYNIECDGLNVLRDKNGFLQNISDWNEDIAEIIAAEEGIVALNEEKKQIIQFLRDFFLKFNAFPILQQICRNAGQPRQCVNEEFIDPMKAWKIAGLPQPEGIHFITVDGRNYLMEQCC